jgi:hypothetical protein
MNEALFKHVVDVRAELGIRRAVDGTAADVGRVLDSKTVHDAINAIDVEAVKDYDTAVAEAVKQIIDSDADRFGAVPAQPPVPAQQGAEEPRQWTDDDVAKASQAELDQAMKTGLLRDLGIGVPKKRAWQR